MAECPAATSSSCTGLNTGESCGPLKAIVPGFPPIEGLTISSDGTSITVEWDTSVSYPDQLIRTHIRELATIGYPPEGFKHTPRNDGEVTHGGLQPDTEHRIWMRVEDDTQASSWLTFRIFTTPGSSVPLDFVLHQGEAVFHIGEIVTY